MRREDGPAAWANARAIADQYGLVTADLGDDPLATLADWVTHARSLDVFEASAMTLATVDASGSPRSRAVLTRGIDARGVVFFTNTHSAKGRELDGSGRASGLFLWSAIRRQVRVDGAVAHVDAAESNAYFDSRPRERQLAAWASDQSALVASREALDEAYADAEARFPGAIPRPPHWGGYRITPDRIEFWQGRETRLHDRFVFTRDLEPTSAWTVARLAP